MNPHDALQSLADNYGIHTSYVDAAGRTQVVSPETVRALLKAFGVETANQSAIEQSLGELEEARSRSVVKPVYVLWGERPQTLTIRSLAGLRATARLRLEPDSTVKLGAPDANGKLRFPRSAYGYHELQIDVAGKSYSSLIIRAPRHAYTLPGTQRRWGIFAPQYAIHSRESWGAGDFCDCEKLAEWTGSLGTQVMALLPMMAGFLDQPFDPSPYSPVSRLFWNEFYLHIPDVPEFSVCAEVRKLAESLPFQKQLQQFRQERLIDYRAEMRLKRSVLEKLAQFFLSRPSERRNQFERFLKTRSEVREYALFRAVTERMKCGWRAWPTRLQHGEFHSDDFDIQSEHYHLFVQWCAQQQIDRLRSAGPILYLDLPLGVHPDGFDAWRERELFVSGVAGGAPPDPFFSKGQNWGFPPMHPQELRRQHYRYFIEFIRFAMRHTGLLRLDHVMGLHRLYWIPDGFPASHGAYVSYPAEELYAILCLESHRHNTALVGENLGTVPPEVNKCLERHRFSKMYIVQYEQQSHPKAALRAAPKECVASLNTHDMPPFAAHWKSLDLADHTALGLLTRKQLVSQKRRREQNNRALVQFLRAKGFLKTNRKMPVSPADVIHGCLRFLSRSKAELVLVNVEDLWDETQPQNTPGTSYERPNWRRKTRLSIEQLQSSDECQAILAEVNRMRRSLVRPRAKRSRK